MTRPVRTDGGEGGDAENGSDEAPSALGRFLYSGILAYMAVDGFKHNDKRVEIAESKGVPMAEHAVPFVTGMLFVANLGVLFWKYPRISAGALVVFFVGTTPAIHNFWTMEGKERNDNKIHFLKNVALLGGAIVFLAEADRAAE